MALRPVLPALPAPRHDGGRHPVAGDRGDRGAVTAETALALPILIAVTIGLVWLLSVGVAQVRMVDVAREAARAVARGEAPADAVARAERVAPDGSRVTVSRGDGTVTVVATGRVQGPGGIFDFLRGVRLEARAVAADEEQP